MSKKRNEEITIAVIVVTLLVGSLGAFIAIFVSGLDATTKSISYVVIALFIYVIWNELHKRFFLIPRSK